MSPRLATRRLPASVSTRSGSCSSGFKRRGGLTALENIAAVPLEAAGKDVATRYARAHALLARVGLADRAMSHPAQLSGGQRQRVAIARALANDARLVLADEPTGALHSDDKAGVIALLTLVHREGKTVVIVTHDDAIAAICDRRLEIRDGHVTEVPSRGPGTGRAA